MVSPLKDLGKYPAKPSVRVTPGPKADTLKIKGSWRAAIKK